MSILLELQGNIAMVCLNDCGAPRACLYLLAAYTAAELGGCAGCRLLELLVAHCTVAQRLVLWTGLSIADFRSLATSAPCVARPAGGARLTYSYANRTDQVP